MNFRFALVFLFLALPMLLQGQPAMLGWLGEAIIARAAFDKPSNWTRGYQAGTGDYCTVTADSNGLALHWKLGAGKRHKYAQCYQVLPAAVSLSSVSLIAVDIKGSPCSGNRDIKIKFEDGSYQAAYTWNRLAASLNWCERIGLLKTQFSDAENVNWNSIKVVSFEVCSDGIGINEAADSGVVHFKNLQMTNMTAWERATDLEWLSDSPTLTSIKENALQAIMDRQMPNGLLCTWREDASSWLYGQGLALKLLSQEGSWIGSTSQNQPAEVAGKLARFLATHQDTKGFWPRAWNANTGNLRQYLEDDSTVWFGDFPWIITGLQNYYLKSGDQSVKPAIDKALAFLKNLVDADGQLFTQNMLNGKKKPVTSVEAYAATILSLQECGEESLANAMSLYIDSHTWDANLKYWREAINSDRIVLFGNVWFAQLLEQQAADQRIAQALSLAGKTMFTCSHGEPCGLDGIGPVAVWYEGTLNYICAGGPGSRYLFDELRKHLNADGTVPHYNASLGAMAGVWAETWPSLDGTSWLYYAAARKSPFTVGKPVNNSKLQDAGAINISPNPVQNGMLNLSNRTNVNLHFELHDMNGSVMKTGTILKYSTLKISCGELAKGVYLLQTSDGRKITSRKVIIAP